MKTISMEYREYNEEISFATMRGFERGVQWAFKLLKEASLTHDPAEWYHKNEVHEMVLTRRKLLTEMFSLYEKPEYVQYMEKMERKESGNV